MPAVNRQPGFRRGAVEQIILPETDNHRGANIKGGLTTLIPIAYLSFPSWPPNADFSAPGHVVSDSLIQDRHLVLLAF